MAAAEQGNAAAQANLGDIYQNGRGVPLDHIEACKWFNLASTQGYRTAADARKSLSAIMTRRQLDEAEARAAEWQRQHQPQPDKLAGGQQPPL